MLSDKIHKARISDVVYLLGISGFFLLMRLGYGALASWDEAIYASVAKEMLKSGDWLHLTINGLSWSDKPPLSIWFTGFFYSVFGINEFSARLFSALCGVGCVIAIYFLGARMFSRSTGLWAALILLSSTHFFRMARFGMTDVPLMLCMTLALYFFWKSNDSNRYFFYSAFMIGAAFMVKGFAAFFIFPIIFGYLLWSGEWYVFSKSSFWLSIVVAVMIALPWNLFELFTHHDNYMNDVVGRHLLGRVFHSIEGHDGNWYFYLRTVINKFHPWILLGVVTGPWMLWKAVKTRSSRAIFLSVWIFFILGTLTFIKTKLHWYILPIYPALSLSVACVIDKWVGSKRIAWIKILFIIVMVAHVHYSHMWDDDYASGIKASAATVQQAITAEETLHLYQYHESPAVTFYCERKSVYLDSSAELLSSLNSKNSIVLLSTKDKLAELLSLADHSQILHEGLGVVVVRLSK